MKADMLLAGMSFRTAPVDVREHLALDEDGIRQHLERLQKGGICSEALLLSTCNRVELYAVPQERGEEKVRRYLQDMHHRQASVEPFIYLHQGREAVLHLFRVAASLDSLVVGEPQILGQVKNAVRVAGEAGCLGPRLGRLAQRSLAAAKRVRTATDIGRFRVGVGNAGVDLAQQIFGELNGRRALLVGAGEMGRQVAKALVGAGVDELVVANRTFERAVEAARDHGGTPIAMEHTDRYLGRVDIVITASGAQEPILRAPAVQAALKARHYRPLFLIDLAVPRNIDPQVADLEEAYLFNIDDLAEVVEQGKDARGAATEEALRLLEGEVDRCLLALREVDASPAIGRLTRHVETLRQQELRRSQKLVGALEPEQVGQMDAMTRALTKKILDGPLRAIREAARQGDDARLRALLEAWETDGEEDS